MESKFKLFCKPLDENYSQEDKDAIEKELHSIFGTLSEEDQIWANRVIYDITTGELNPEGKRLTDLIASYKTRHENDIIRKFAHAIGVDEEKLRALKNDFDGANINRNGRFDDLKSTLQIDAARAYIESIDGKKLKDYEIRMRADELLRKFIEDGTTIGIE